MMPELYLADALGRAGKPMFRVHTAGSVGGSTAIVAPPASCRPASTSGCSPWPSRSSPRARPCGRCRCRSRSSRRMHAGAGGYFAPHIRAYIRRSGAPDHIGILVGVKDRAERAEEPLRPPPRARHHLRLGQGLDDAVGPDPLPRDVPVVRRRLRHGAHQRGRRRCRAAPRPAWVQGTAMRSEPDDVRRPRPGEPPGGQGLRRRRLRARPASPTRAARSTWSRCTCRSPGSSRCGSRTSASRPTARAGR